nr:MAG TPA: hypothetical protein [Caudoviricetes sp.]
MSVVKKDEIVERIISRMDEDNKSDEDIKLIEDVTDTFDFYENQIKEDWKQKYEENDRQWREKYVSRFMNKEIEDKPETVVEIDDKVLKYEDLFEEVK